MFPFAFVCYVISIWFDEWLHLRINMFVFTIFEGLFVRFRLKKLSSKQTRRTCIGHSGQILSYSIVTSDIARMRKKSINHIVWLIYGKWVIFAQLSLWFCCSSLILAIGKRWEKNRIKPQCVKTNQKYKFIETHSWTYRFDPLEF